MVMEYVGGEEYPSSSVTFIFSDVTHTLANPVRFTLNQDPRVSSCAYTIPTPDEDPQYDPPRDPPLNFRVQTTGDDARDVFKDAVQELLLMCKHVRSTFDQSVADFKNSPPSFPSSSSSSSNS
ncbi:probable DNA-directed RNA polymerases I and III subunit RPAC2 [Impatiens glandulifera]|uniref:probable DNA-directed RNA polymerases I and III subunit RPAC2 n=1 Tax=Impatiens glandulifera TaxID=253017 RepID=UPI001FB0D867|nr:probable DNA-directed RNA polymerases I and III subunit RPAC2 [Impatiens glandulifera]